MKKYLTLAICLFAAPAAFSDTFTAHTYNQLNKPIDDIGYCLNGASPSADSEGTVQSGSTSSGASIDTTYAIEGVYVHNKKEHDEGYICTLPSGSLTMREGDYITFTVMGGDAKSNATYSSSLGGGSLTCKDANHSNASDACP